MDRPQLLQHFDTLAETPEAVAKLREFVLGLAVRGQLLPQNPEDEKHARWKEFGARFARPETENGDEPPFPTPKSWRWVRLNDVADYAAADKVDPSEIKDGDWVLDLEEIEKDTSRIVRIARFAEKQSSSTKAKFLPGDVLYGKLRPYLNKVVVAPQAGFCTTEIIPIRSRGLIEPTYLCIFLRSPDFVNYANSKSYGMKMPRLGTDDAVSAWVAIPPLAEQRRIVAKVEELLALCDELEARQTAAREHRTRLVRSALDHLTTVKDESAFRKHSAFCLQHSELLFDCVPALRQAILSLAVQGRLLLQNPKDEPGEKLLERLRKKYRTPKAQVNGEEKPFALPNGWTWARFPELGVFSRGKSRHRPRGDSILYSDGKYPLVQTGDVARASGVIQTFTGLYNETGLAQSRLWPEGTLCITIAANIADSGLLGMEACIPDSIVGFIPDEELGSAKYFEFFMRTAKEHLQDFAPSTAQKNINVAILEAVLIPFPPLAEQQRIVAKVDELMRWCDALEDRLTAAQTTATHLLYSTLRALLAA